jgi:hypothetical protein
VTQRRLMSRVIVTAVLLCAAAFVALAPAAAPARADSLTFIKDHNVWLANPDGWGQYQVTLDGTPGSPYESPSQADDGTIVAIRRPPGQRNQLFRMSQSGTLLNPPIDTPAPGPAGALDPKVSPDGRLVAYWFVTAVNHPICTFCIQAASQALLTRSDRFTGYEEVGTPNTGIRPSWISNDTLLLNNSNATQWYYRLGMPEAAQWFADYETGFSQTPIQLLDDSDLARTGTRLAIVRGDNNETLVLYTTAGVPPASTVPPTARCVYSGATGGRFFNPAWSQDGQTLAWQEGDGIWTAQINTLSDCSANPPAALRIPAASEPDFGPAAVNPGPRPPCGNPGNPVACVGPPPPCCAPPPRPRVDLAAVRRALEALAEKVVRRFARIGVRGMLRKKRLTVGFDNAHVRRCCCFTDAGPNREAIGRRRPLRRGGPTTATACSPSRARPRLSGSPRWRRRHEGGDGEARDPACVLYLRVRICRFTEVASAPVGVKVSWSVARRRGAVRSSFVPCDVSLMISFALPAAS